MKLIILITLHCLITLFLILLVIFQQSRGAEVGAAFGGGNTLLGPGGADKVAIRITTITAIIFMISTIVLVNIFSEQFQARKVEQIESKPFSQQN
ncbi:MAG: preprotein translocase subunit SecG [Deltaproteobacteria bacterium]|nr:preprotein translocase subunit SecG [Deltaproteobacteria bacterium]